VSDLILQALGLLDPTNDDHWTEDGLPRVDVVKELTGLKDIKRGDITGLAPELTRDSVRAAAVVVHLMSPPDTTPPADVAARNELEQGAMEGDTLDGVEEDTLEARLQDVEKRIAARQDHINAETRILQRLADERDELIQLLDPGTGNHRQNQENIMAFLQRQHQNRMQKAAQRAAILGHLDPSTADPRSALDRAFSRKNSRGAVPPTRREQR
jgi:TolA-binding protein